MAHPTDKQGVILINMGGPRRKRDLRRFLYTLFADPLILGLPAIVRPGVAHLIAAVRKPKAWARYAMIGGSSPLYRETELQAERLSAKLGYPVRFAMRYSPPSIEDTCHAMKDEGITRLVAIPLYPQYSRSTTESVRHYFAGRADSIPPFRFVDHHYNHPLFIKTLSRLLSRELVKLKPGLKTGLVYVAHSIPASLVRAGDPYVEQVEATVSLLEEDKSLPVDSYLAYQSRLGPVKWQGPSLRRVLGELRMNGVERIVVQPVSFACENLETLYDLDIEFKKECSAAGIQEYIRIPAPGTHPLYIDALAAIASAQFADWDTEGKADEMEKTHA